MRNSGSLVARSSTIASMSNAIARSCVNFRWLEAHQNLDLEVKADGEEAFGRSDRRHAARVQLVEAHLHRRLLEADAAYAHACYCARDLRTHAWSDRFENASDCCSLDL